MSYLSILKNNESKIKIKRSEFIGNCRKINTEDEAKLFIKEISEKYKNATHNCWAYFVHEERDKYNYSDNGEPSGTAGKPIFGEIQKNNLRNIVIVITRFFGGVKLGVRGLIDAYSKTAEKVIFESKIVEYRNSKIYNVNIDYSNYSELERLLKREKGWQIENINYTDRVNFNISIDERKIEDIKSLLEKRVLEISFLQEEEKPYKVRD